MSTENNTASDKKIAIVTGGSRGLGRGIAEALLSHGVRTIALAHEAAGLTALTRECKGIEPVLADAADELVAGRLLQERRPDLVVLCAGATPLLRPLHYHTWETFSQNWEVDAKSIFVWLRNALLLPMKPGSQVVIVSSMAAVNGSPLSGGYAGAKRMLWFMAEYASQEVNRLKLGIHIHCLLPTLNPNTNLGRAAIAAYAERAGVSLEEFAKRLAPHLTPAIMGEAVVDLYSNPANWDKLAYQISGSGLNPFEKGFLTEEQPDESGLLLIPYCALDVRIWTRQPIRTTCKSWTIGSARRRSVIKIGVCE